MTTTQPPNQVWKYAVPMPGETRRIDVPTGSTWLALQLQNEGPVAWALVRPDAPIETITLRTVGTGHPFDAKLFDAYLGTWQDGDLVWHVFATSTDHKR